MATLDEVYCKFGEVSEAAQLLETELGNFLLIVGAVDANLIEQKDPEIAAAMFKSINRHTLGQLMKRLHKSTDFAVHIESLLARALVERNRLSHSFYRQHNFRRNSDEGRSLMLNDLNAIHEILLEAYKAALLLSGIDLSDIVMDIFPKSHVPI